jgi:hypothetical protein
MVVSNGQALALVFRLDMRCGRSVRSRDREVSDSVNVDLVELGRSESNVEVVAFVYEIRVLVCSR